jgi:hypothetical protein
MPMQHRAGEPGSSRLLIAHSVSGRSHRATTNMGSTPWADRVACPGSGPNYTRGSRSCSQLGSLGIADTSLESLPRFAGRPRDLARLL